MTATDIPQVCLVYTSSSITSNMCTRSRTVTAALAAPAWAARSASPSSTLGSLVLGLAHIGKLEW